MPLTYHHQFYTSRQVAELLGISSQRACKLPLDWEIINGARSVNILNLFTYVKTHNPIA